MSLLDLRTLLKSKVIFFGTKETLKSIRNGKVNTVFLAGNCPEKIKSDIDYYAKLKKLKIVKLKQPNDEIALICKKNYLISVISCYDEKV